MRNIKTVTLLISTLLFMVSCSEDGDDGPSGFSDADLVGEWVLIEVNLSSEIDVDGDGQTSSNLMDEIDCISGSFVFHEDVTYNYEQTSFRVIELPENEFGAECYGTNLATGAWVRRGSEIAFQANNLLTGTMEIMGIEF